MRDIHYKNRNYRVSDEVHETMQSQRRSMGLSWNMYLKRLTELAETDTGRE